MIMSRLPVSASIRTAQSAGSPLASSFSWSERRRRVNVSSLGRISAFAMNQNHATIIHEPPLPGFVYGIGAAMQTLNEMAVEIARTDIPVLVVGESGTGKDAYAKLIHRLSSKGGSRFKKINCASFEPAGPFGQ